MLGRHRVFRNIELKTTWLGLEPLSALSLLGLLWLLQLVNRGRPFLNLLVIVLAWGALRLLLRGKPEHHGTTVLRFYTRRPFFSAAAPDDEGRRHPFLPGAKALRSPSPEQET